MVYAIRITGYKTWDVPRIYNGLYESIFPANFREDLQERLMKATQHGRPLKDFARDLENLAMRYWDIDGITLRQIFWEGADNYT